FFKVMDNEAGEDLSWFWRGWFLHNWSYDIAVQSVQNSAPATASATPNSASGSAPNSAGSTTNNSASGTNSNGSSNSTAIATPNSAASAEVAITLANLDRMAFPAILELTWKDGTKQRISLPVETWLQSGTRTLRFPATQPLAAVTVDPDHALPDANRANNTWTAP
ncbi:MAG TPA: hypothetical protein VKQ52_11015, partial [Puia sp.]|nr:hypothetical protein [Puia sp.]